MKAYSQDLRQRVLRSIDQGKSQAEVAETFAISTATLKRYLKARRESGHVLVFVDETGSHIAMTPLYAYAPRGERAVGKVPRNYGAIMTLIASMSLAGMGPAFILDGAADSTAFEIYVEQILAPSLRPGQI